MAHYFHFPVFAKQKRTRAFCSFMLLISIFFIDQASAAGFCDELKSFSNAGSLEKIKGSWDADAEEYESTAKLEGFDSCSISETLRRFRCSKGFAGKESAVQEQKRLTSKVLACFSGGAQVISDEISPDKSRKTYVSLGGPSTMIRAVSPQRADYNVSASGHYSRKRESESWRVSIAISQQ